MLNAMQPFGLHPQPRSLRSAPRFAAQQATVPPASTKEPECHTSSTTAEGNMFQHCYQQHKPYYHGFGALIVALAIWTGASKLKRAIGNRFFKKESAKEA